MQDHAPRLCHALVLSLALAAAPACAQRSFVGRRLPCSFVDTEGHVIEPKHYDGSVLVMLSGIPW